MGDVTRLSIDGLSVYTQWAAQAYDDAARLVNRETEEFFERLHRNANKDEPAYTYHPEDYVRYQVNSKKEAESIVNALGKEQVKDIIYTPIEINGHYFLELPKTDQSHMDEYQNAYDTSAREVPQQQVAQITDDSEQRGTGSAYTSAIMNGLETLGATISRISSAEVRTANHANDTIQIRVDDENRIRYFHKDKEITISKDGQVFRDGTVIHNKQFAASVREAVREQNNKLGEELQRRIPTLRVTANKEGAVAAAAHLSRGDSSMAKHIREVLRSQDGVKVAIKHDRAKKVDMELTSRWSLGSIGQTAVRLRQKELMGDATIANAFRKDFGLAAGAALTPDVLAGCTRELMDRANKENIRLTTINGNLDAKAFDALTPGQLEKLGISQSTAKEIAGFGNLKTNQLGKTQGTSFKKMGATLFIGKAADDEDTQHAINNARQGTRITKTTVKEMKRTRDAARYQREASKLKKADQNGGLTDKYRKNKTRKQSTMSEAQKRRQAKYAERFEKKVKKTERNIRKNSLSNRVHRASNKWAKRLNESKLMKPVAALNKAAVAAKKKLAQWLAAAAGHLIVPMFVVILIVAVLFVIQAMINAVTDKIGAFFLGKLQPDTVEETAFHEIYQFLNEEEEHWIRDLNTALTSLNNTEKRNAAKFGTQYRSFESYLRGREDLKYGSGGKVYSTIFTDRNGNWNTNIEESPMLVQLKFDGVYDTKISTNNNIYSATDLDSQGYTSQRITAQTGHTSNIKDILAMMDVMYGENASDDGINMLTQRTAAGIKWENFKSWVKNVILFCKLWFSGDDNWREDYHAQKKLIVGYDTILSYAEHLFAATHQMQIELEVQYYEVQPEVFCSEELLSKGQSFYSKYGMCIDPATINLPIDYDPITKKIRPYLSKSAGRTDWTDVGSYKQNITLSDLASMQDHSICLWDGMAGNKDTYNKIAKSSCWGTPITARENVAQRVLTTKKNGQEVTATSLLLPNLMSITATPQTLTIPAGYDLDSVKAKIVENTRAAYTNAKNRGIFAATYVLKSDRNSFTRTRYELPDLSLFTAAEIKEEDGTVLPKNVKWRIEPYTQKLIFPTIKNGKLVQEVRYLNMLQITYLCPEIKQVKETYYRSCAGHTFRYCAGHICAHTTGIVYSITNDQIAAVNTGNMNLNAVNYEHSDQRSEIVGKLDESTLIRTEAPLAEVKASGASRMPLADAQGSFAGRKGRNIYVKDGVWSEGKSDSDQFHVSENMESCGWLMQDIFDVDTLIEKGACVFPIRYAWEYEGWTATNMTLAIGKMSGDWMELYGFDIPISIEGQLCLSEDDITLFMEELDAAYGDNISQSRKDGVEAALRSVGTGVLWNENEHRHAFLTNAHPCLSHKVEYEDGEGYTVNYDASCTGGGPQDYISYLWQLMGGRWSYDRTYGSAWFGGGTPYPGDVVYIPPDSKWQDILKPTEDEASTRWHFIGLLDEWELKYQKDRNSEKYLFYLGKFSHSFETSTGMSIPAGVPVFVEFHRAKEGDLYGSIYLRFCVSDYDTETEWYYTSDCDIYRCLLNPAEQRKAVFIPFTAR